MKEPIHPWEQERAQTQLWVGLGVQGAVNSCLHSHLFEQLERGVD